jgi:type II secretory pathway pseudopilin PulG
MRKLRKQAGLSLVEVTIMLLVLMLLTSVLAPSIFDFVYDAERVKVKEDCEAIGVSIARLVRDVGPCLMVNAGVGCVLNNRADVLVSDGNFPGLRGDGAIPNPWARAMNTQLWLKSGDTLPAMNADTLENQLATNTPGYPAPATWVGGGWYPIPVFGLGYRGAYIAPPIGPDPWGDGYQVNTGFLAVANDATTGGAPFTGTGQRNGFWDVDVFCISAGPNKLIDTAFGGFDAAHPDVHRRVDDFVFVISGSTR